MISKKCLWSQLSTTRPQQPTCNRSTVLCRQKRRHLSLSGLDGFDSDSIASMASFLCIEYLEKRSQFQMWEYKGRQIDRRDLLASAIKWTVAAPFNFALKQLNCKPYLRGFDMTGER